MCGILVYISHKEIPQSKAVKIKNLMQCEDQMINLIKRLNLTKKIYIFFTQDYLFKIYIEDPNQPYNFKDYLLVFNGEIYNFKELKNKNK